VSLKCTRLFYVYRHADTVRSHIKGKASHKIVSDGMRKFYFLSYALDMLTPPASQHGTSSVT
jgi:hypothetical protein